MEIWAHVGKAKSAQRNKVLADVLKMALVSDFKKKEGFEVESYFAFVDNKAQKVLEGDSWGALAAKHFGVTPIKVDLDTATLEKIKTAQESQDLQDE